MLRENLLTGLLLSYLIAGFLIPTLFNTGLYHKFPAIYILVFLFAVFPILALVGIIIAFQLGKKIRLVWQFAKFALVGILNTAIDFGALNTLVLWTGIYKGSGTLFINPLGFILAVCNSYYWNRRWTFAGAKQGNFIVFVAVTLVGLAINNSIVYGISTYVSPYFGASGAQWINVAKVGATAISLFWNFAGYKLIVFKR